MKDRGADANACHRRRYGLFIGIEEPENFLHPRLLQELAEEARRATARSQLLVTSHSPFFINALKADEVRILYRDGAGYTQAVRAEDVRGIPEFMAAGASLDHLWLAERFGVGDPLVRHGQPSPAWPSRSGAVVPRPDAGPPA